MKTTIALLAIFLLTQSTQCKKDFDLFYKGELLDVANCGAPVIKILDGDLTQINHEDTWTNPATGQVYTNVFVVKNHCYFSSKGFAPGDTFNFTVESSFNDAMCAVCMALFPVPSKTNFIKIAR